jgi:hypothetical protein
LAAPAHRHGGTERTHLDTDRSEYDHAAIRVGDEGGGLGLDDDPFSCQNAKDGRVLILRDGRQVAVIAGAQADPLRPKLANAPDEAQHALARATGNHRRGYERRGSHR